MPKRTDFTVELVVEDVVLLVLGGRVILAADAIWFCFCMLKYLSLFLKSSGYDGEEGVESCEKSGSELVKEMK